MLSIHYQSPDTLYSQLAAKCKQTFSGPGRAIVWVCLSGKYIFNKMTCGVQFRLVGKNCYKVTLTQPKQISHIQRFSR